MNDKVEISVVIPVYGSASILQLLHDRITTTVSQITDQYEIILVNDHSPDDAWEQIRFLAEHDAHVTGIKFSRNFGQHNAITAGLEKSSGEWVVVMDCDLQDQPEEIMNFYSKAQEGFEIVLGRREERNDRFLKRLSSKFFYKLFGYLTDTIYDSSIANFGIYHRKVIDSIISMKEKLRFFPSMVKWVGFKNTSIPIEHANRQEGKSGYSFSRLVKLALDVILAFSDKPLRLTVRLGIYMSLFAFLYALYIVFRALFGIRPIEGWASLFVSIWFLSGLIIFVLGILGIYISRIFDEVKNRPLYIIEEMYSKKEKQ
jgi:polyisoprenyl-phosphate glycosyltransferase